jgi:hypothetical protein
MFIVPPALGTAMLKATVLIWPCTLPGLWNFSDFCRAAAAPNTGGEGLTIVNQATKLLTPDSFHNFKGKNIKECLQKRSDMKLTFFFQ